MGLSGAHPKFVGQRLVVPAPATLQGVR